MIFKSHETWQSSTVLQALQLSILQFARKKSATSPGGCKLLQIPPRCAGTITLRHHISAHSQPIRVSDSTFERAETGLLFDQ